MSGTDNGGLPDTGRHPAYMNIHDTQVFNDAGLTPLSVLRDRFGTGSMLVWMTASGTSSWSRPSAADT